MELEFQWGLVEDEIADVFGTLLPAVNAQLLYLKSFIQGRFMNFPQRLEDITNPRQRKGSLARYREESILEFKISNTGPG